MNDSIIDRIREAALKIYELPEFTALPLEGQLTALDSLRHVLMAHVARVDEE